MLYEQLSRGEELTAIMCQWQYPAGIAFDEYLSNLGKSELHKQVSPALEDLYYALRGALGYAPRQVTFGFGFMLPEYKGDHRKAFVEWVKGMESSFNIVPDMECEQAEKEEILERIEKSTRLYERGKGAVLEADGWHWQGTRCGSWKALAEALLASFDAEPSAWGVFDHKAMRQSIASINKTLRQRRNSEKED